MLIDRDMKKKDFRELTGISSNTVTKLANNENVTMEVIEKIAFHLLTIKDKVHTMVEARKIANKIENEREKAIAYHDTVAPHLDEIRYHIDKLELMIDNEMWPLPKYRELLFIR